MLQFIKSIFTKNKFTINNFQTAKKENSNKYQTDYETIGTTLWELECSNLKLGIPLLFPTSRVIKTKKKIRNVEKYLKINLVNVKTDSLSSYIEDLTNLSLTTENNEYFKIPRISDLERFGMFFLFAIVLGLTIILTGEFFEFSSENLIISILVVSEFVVCAINFLFCSEPYRKNTFLVYLNRELLRRKGIDRNSQNMNPDLIT